jgi:hypothetical protein
MALQGLHEARGSLAKRIWRQVAFLGRYANQPADVSLSLPFDDLQRLVEETSIILEQENESMKRE